MVCLSLSKCTALSPGDRGAGCLKQCSLSFSRSEESWNSQKLEDFNGFPLILGENGEIEQHVLALF